ncbi:MAG: hypothetical protein QM796_11045 [Chthoniobacteraceae bacterium]
MGKKATLHLPNGIEIELEDFDISLGRLIELSQEALDDLKITPEDFGPMKYFFFVNSSTGSLMDDTLSLKRSLSSLAINDRDIIELRLCNPATLPDGRVLNPMRGVQFYIK